jgi:hypothetical protein
MLKPASLAVDSVKSIFYLFSGHYQKIVVLSFMPKLNLKTVILSYVGSA